jgi:hypothetical protein
VKTVIVQPDMQGIRLAPFLFLFQGARVLRQGLRIPPDLQLPILTSCAISTKLTEDD